MWFYCVWFNDRSSTYVQQISNFFLAWWRHPMETFSALLALCAGNSPVTGEFPSQRPVTRSFGVFFHLCLNKRLSKQPWGWWFETPSCSLWSHCNGYRSETVSSLGQLRNICSFHRPPSCEHEHIWPDSFLVVVSWNRKRITVRSS